MKPRQLITEHIDMTLNKTLSELGFKFSKNALTFKRGVNEFSQTIHFQLNRYNQENECAEFWASFAVSSKKYSKWYKAEFGIECTNDLLDTEMDWNMKGWEFPITNNKRQLHFQIINEEDRENVMSVLKENILNIGIPYLNDISNWENAANQLVQKEWFHFKACDFFLIAENKEKALWALQQGLDCWERKPNASFPDDKNEIYVRLSKYFNPI